MSNKSMDDLISEIMRIMGSHQEPLRAVKKEILECLEESWQSDTFAGKFLKRFTQKPDEFAPVLEDLLNDKLPRDPALTDRLNRIVSAKGTRSLKTNASEISTLSQSEIEVLKALEQIGGSGNPIDIAIEGMLDIQETHKTAERLWRKGLLLSHPLKDPDAKRFFAFSDLNKDRYRKLLEASDA